MISNFDLNIQNYSKRELEDILELPLNYDENMIEIKSTKLIQNVANDKTVSGKTKTDTLFFINEIKKILKNFLEKNGINVSAKVKQLETTTKNIYNLDKTLRPSDVTGDGGTYIIQRPNTAFAKSLPSEFYEGVINPLTKRILRQNINIDTRFRENYFSTQSSNFHLDLPLRLTQVVSLQLSALELPSTFYAISQVFGNNYFVIRIAGEDPLIVTIPDGNYTYSVLQTYLNTYLTGITIPLPYQSLSFTADNSIPSSVPSGTGKMSVSSSTSTPFTLDFSTNKNGNEDNSIPLQLKFGWVIGFRKATYSGLDSYTSEGVVDLVGPKYLYLVIDDFNNNQNDGFYGAFTSSILNKNILARISINGSVFNILSQNNLSLITTPRQYFGPVDIQKLQVQLLDEYGRVIDLHNMDYSFCLTFQTVYDL
jgi:hypothetical protein